LTKDSAKKLVLADALDREGEMEYRLLNMEREEQDTVSNRSSSATVFLIIGKGFEDCKASLLMIVSFTESLARSASCSKYSIHASKVVRQYL
jgi:hypothetical protein